MNVRPLLAVTFALALAAACGNSNPEPKGPAPSPTPSEMAPSATPSASAAEAAAASAAPAPSASVQPSKSWDDMNHDERLALMKNVVSPKMKEVFQKFDAKKFADFSCKTCHGKPENKGKMPNDDVPKLDAKNMFEKHKKKTPEELEWMMKTVSPQMADLLGLPHFDPATGKGFGCGGCHFFAK
jgi:cytochrome c553